MVVAERTGWLGFTAPRVTPVGADEGIDVTSVEAIAPVKMEGVKTGRPESATEWADRVEVALFRFDLQGTPEPVDAAAHRLFTAASGTA